MASVEITADLLAALAKDDKKLEFFAKLTEQQEKNEKILAAASDAKDEAERAREEAQRHRAAGDAAFNEATAKVATLERRERDLAEVQKKFEDEKVAFEEVRKKVDTDHSAREEKLSAAEDDFTQRSSALAEIAGNVAKDRQALDAARKEHDARVERLKTLWQGPSSAQSS